jgi:DNA repair exonuclease SbcCD nuclease subunit
MIKKVYHFADVHIRTLRMHDEYKEVFNNLLNDIKSSMSEYKREEVRILIAGDIFHQKNTISNEQLILAAWLLKKLEEIAPLVLIAGNHDAVLNNNDRVDSITPIVQLLGDIDINYFKESKCYLDDNIVWCVYSVFEDNKRPDIESARVEFGDDKKYIGLFHAPVLNAKTDIGYSIDHGVGLDLFEGLDAVMMGDIHLHQVFIHKQTKEIFEDELEEYKNKGWGLDN